VTLIKQKDDDSPDEYARGMLMRDGLSVLRNNLTEMMTVH